MVSFVKLSIFASFLQKSTMLNKILIALLLGIVLATNCCAQNATIIITQGGLPYKNSTWFYSGLGEDLDRVQVKENWAEGRRITSMAYTAHGWFVSMAKNTGIVEQTYNSVWDDDWIKDNWNKGFYITSLSYGNDACYVVMSEGIDYRSQSYNRSDWSEMEPWIKQQWDKGRFITSAAYDGKQWTLVMSETKELSYQGYLWATSYKELTKKLQETVWSRGLRLVLMEYGHGEYFAVFGDYRNNSTRAECLIDNPSDVQAYLDEEWSRSHEISYIGGGFFGNKLVNWLKSVF